MTDDVALSSDDILAMLQESQHWPRATLLAYQRSQLEQLLRHARAHVPFYKTRLDCMFRKDGSVDWQRWHDIPILTRQDLRDNRDAMQARVLPPGHGRVSTASSSGSTGVPVTVSFPALAIHAGQAAWQRMMMAHGFDRFRRIVEFKLNLPNGKPLPSSPHEVRQPSDGSVKFFIDRRALPEEKLVQLRQCQVDMVVDTPNSLEILARVNLLKRDPVRFKGAMGIGMGFTDVQRQLILESFGARCLSPYSSKEGTLIAGECAVTHQFHVSAELMLFECLGPDNAEVATGQQGRVVITPFFYTAQPLIRYDQGDIVTPGGPCACGCTLPVIRSIEGRSDPIFQFPGREAAITGLDFEAPRKDLDAIATQIAQVGPFNLEIRYVAGHAASMQGMADFTSRVQDCLGSDIALTFRKVDVIPTNAGGKQQRMVREFPPGT